MKSELAFRGSLAISLAAMPTSAIASGSDDHQVMVGRVGIGEDDLHRLPDGHGELRDREQHPLGYARDIDQLQIRLAVELGLGRVRERLLDRRSRGWPLSAAGQSRTAACLPSSGRSVCDSNGTPDGIGEMPFARMFQDVERGLERLACVPM